MKTVNLKTFGSIISDQTSGETIYAQIKEIINNNELCVVDFKDIRSMATFNAKQIFGKLYLELGSENFFNKIELKNASNDLQLIIRLGIQSAVEDKEI